jgi:hypothetical protein
MPTPVYKVRLVDVRDMQSSLTLTSLFLVVLFAIYRSTRQFPEPNTFEPMALTSVSRQVAKTVLAVETAEVYNRNCQDRPAC